MKTKTLHELASEVLEIHEKASTRKHRSKEERVRESVAYSHIGELINVLITPKDQQTNTGALLTEGYGIENITEEQKKRILIFLKSKLNTSTLCAGRNFLDEKIQYYEDLNFNRISFINEGFEWVCGQNFRRSQTNRYTSIIKKLGEVFTKSNYFESPVLSPKDLHEDLMDYVCIVNMLIETRQLTEKQHSALEELEEMAENINQQIYNSLNI